METEALPKFARKENVAVAPEILADMRVMVPTIYYWERVVGGKSEMMTMAFRYKGMSYGMSFPIEDQNFVKIDMLRGKLWKVVKECADVLTHHGDKVLDASGNIDLVKLNDQEAIRFKYDPHWQKKVAAFNQLVKVTPITESKAIKLKLLDNARII